MIYLTNIVKTNNKNSIEDCLFDNNRLSMNIGFSGDIEIIRCNFSNNNGGLYFFQYGNISINLSRFSNNNAYYGGGGIYSLVSKPNSLLQIVNSIFTENNSSNYYGGVFFLAIWQNISIISCNFSNNNAYNGGGAIYLTNSKSNSMLQIVNSIFTENNSSDYYGGAIYIEEFEDVLINSSIFRNNNANKKGGAIYAINSFSISMLQIINSIFTENNSPNYGGAIYFEQLGNISINSSDFNNNYANDRGGAIFLINSQINSLLQIVISTFSENNSPVNYGGAIYFEQIGNITINSSNFTNNYAELCGGAIYAVNYQSNSALQIESSVFAENNAPSYYGGSIYFSQLGKISINSSHFSKSYASYGGGAIYAQSNSFLQIFGSIFNENNSTYYGCAIYSVQSGNISINSSNFSNNHFFFMDASYGSGGSIFSIYTQLNSMFQIVSSIFTENNSTYYGGAIYLEQFANILINSSIFSNNYAEFGGGGAICLIHSQPNSLLHIFNSIFADNKSPYYYGGAIYFVEMGNISIHASNFSNNYDFYRGGAIYSFNSQSNFLFQIFGSIFTENNSTYYGGAIYLEQFENISIYSSNFSNNYASYGGGAIYAFKSQTDSIFQLTKITDSVFFENNSTSEGGGIYFDQLGNISLSTNKFSKNMADSAGAIFIFNLPHYSFQQITECFFSENNSTSYGGALYMKVTGNFFIAKSEFHKNLGYFFGGAIFLFNLPSNFQIAESIFSENNCTNLGGAIYLQSFSNISIITSIFSKNSADLGAAIYLIHSQYNSLLKIDGCIFNENNSTSYGAGITLKDVGDTDIENSNFTHN